MENTLGSRVLRDIFSSSHFPLGVAQVLLTTKLRLKVFVVPPGKFFDPARKQNLLIINTGYNYIYTLRSLLMVISSYHYYQLHYSYTLTKHINSWKNPCKSNLAWKEDDCKLGQFSASFREKFNCTVPWLHYLTPHLHICRPNTRQSRTSRSDTEGDVMLDVFVFSYSASEFYYQTKYPSYPECRQSCVRMDVEAKFKTKSVFGTDPSKSRTTFIFPMEVPVTEEFYTASPLSLGKNSIFQSE